MTGPARAGWAALDPCVHCGFCLPACPTYLATGDENDSPRGRIVLMRALERGEIAARDPALRTHLERCLGCRGCEPVCPSGVGYGRGLETARQELARSHGLPLAARLWLRVFERPWRWRLVFGLGRALRPLARLAGRPGRILASTGPAAVVRPSMSPRGLGQSSPTAPGPQTVVLFRGCIMDVLFRHVHEATRRVLEANGYRVVEVRGQTCCGALHAHAGDNAGARRLAARNVAALAGQADWIAVNSAGCGALLKDYGHLLGTSGAAGLAARTRDVTELLALAGPRTAGRLDLDVAYDPPCHLQHAQGVHREALAVLNAIPGLRVRLLEGHDRCCGGAGLYTVLQSRMSEAVLADKVAAIRAADPRPAVVTTGNPGCIMQIGAGLRAAGLDLPVVHPVELLDLAYGGVPGKGSSRLPPPSPIPS
jgi:glycolate oxidase iron-sulfur subunit